ncbi:MAG: FecR family protein [Bacteroidales bacterium]
MKKDDLDRLEEYFKNETSNDKYAEEIFGNDECEEDLKKAIRSKWMEILSSSTFEYDLDHILHKIHFEINSRKPVYSITNVLYKSFSNIAAILVLPLLLLSAYYIYNDYSQTVQYAEIVAPKGEKARFVLPDGSCGYLNSGTSLRYAYPFDEERIVSLSGEAFFDVAHSDKTFVVQTQGLDIKVHGTVFNVCAYDDDSQITTTLEAGSISAMRHSDGKAVKIKPNQQVIFDKNTQKISCVDVDIDLYTSWKDKMLRFQNTPFVEVVKKMERWYDVRIVLSEKLKYSQYYTMTVKTESLREMLELMKVTTPMKYEVKEDSVYITNIK